MVVALSAIDDATFKDFSSLTISITGAAINLIIILILNVIYDKIAIWLTNKELHRCMIDYFRNIWIEFDANATVWNDVLYSS